MDVKISNDTKCMIEIIREKRMKDGYKVTHKCNGKYTIEEIVSRMIKSHT